MITTQEEFSWIEFSKRVELDATRLLEGMHRSSRGSSGQEFESIRAYEPGDELRTVDWKRMAATDRVYVRKFLRDEQKSWSFWLDGSPSMQCHHKSESARIWMGIFCFLAKTWNDSFEVSGEKIHSLPDLWKPLAEGQCGISEDSLVDSLPEKSTHTVIISDFFWEEQNLKKLKRWLEEGKSAWLIQSLAPEEINFTLHGLTHFLDSESKDQLLLDPATLRSQYLKAFHDLQSLLKGSLGDNQKFFCWTIGSSSEKIFEDAFEVL